MCGILAIARSDPAATPLVGARELEAAMVRLRRRGPDGEGVYRTPDGRVLLGHTRLAIQDPSAAGRQPMGDAGSGEEPGVVVSFNGEIYNAPALRRELEEAGCRFRSRTDTEVLVHGFGVWGFEGLLSRLHGMLALVLLDRREATDPVLYGAVDHAGMKPLVWAELPGGGLAMASDCDALLALCDGQQGFTRALDPVGLGHVLSMGYCPAPGTVWRGVRKLGPGEMMTWRVNAGGSPRIGRHWRPPEQVDADRAGERQEEFEALFRMVVDEHLLADVPVGLFLSAGLDSTAIALALAEAGRAGDVTACTLAFEGVDGSQNEAPTAAATARAMMMGHRTIGFGEGSLRATIEEAAAAFDEPQGFTALLTAVRIAGRAREEGLKVVLGGDGGDEALAGYAWHRGDPHPHSLTGDELGAHGGALARRTYPYRYLRRLFGGFDPLESRSLLRGLESGYDAESFAGWLGPEDRPGLPFPRRVQRLDLAAFCAGSILSKIDRSAMGVGLEVRSPFLDRRLLEWTLRRPVEAGETTSTGGKPALRRFLRRGVEAGAVPREVLTRPKQGFSVRSAAARPFEGLAAEMVPGSRLVRDGVVRGDYGAFLPRDVESREARAFTLCMMAAWYERRSGG